MVPARLRVAAVGSLSALCDKVVDGEADIAGNLTEQDRREITPGMDRDGRGAAVRMPEPLVRAPVAGFREAERLQNADDLARPENRNGGHVRSEHDGLRADVVTDPFRSPVLMEQRDDFTKIGVEFVERLALAVGTREARNVADVQAGVGAALDDRGVRVHHGSLTVREWPRNAHCRCPVLARKMQQPFSPLDGSRP